MMMPGRKYQATSAVSYRYGFNGKEKLDEIKGDGNGYDFGTRILDPRLGRWLSVDPMQRKYPDVAPYVAFGNNPISVIDPDGKDIVYFNSDGVEYHRVQSKTLFVTYVDVINKIEYFNPHYDAKSNSWQIFESRTITSQVKVPMPKIIQTRVDNNGRVEDVTNPKYQVNDYQIAASTFLTNNELKSGVMSVVDRGGNFIPSINLKVVPEIPVDRVKAWSMQETHAGTENDGAGILQVNVVGDFTKDKTGLGITKGAVYSAHKEINLAIRYAIGKGFTSDGKGNWTWNGWIEALKRFGPGSKDPLYQDKIMNMENQSKEPKPKDY